MSHREEYEINLDPVHRALIGMMRERLVDPVQIRALDGMSEKELCDMLRHEMSREPIAIPAKSAPVPCRWCQQLVYRITGRHKVFLGPNHTGSRDRVETVSINGSRCRAPTETDAGEGVLHLVDCPRSGLLIGQEQQIAS